MTYATAEGSKYWPISNWSLKILITAMSIAFAGLFAWMNYAYHENRLWFSNIDEVEREISFRTECGLYYSYFKQLIDKTNDPQYSLSNFYNSVSDLRSDNRTEAPHHINIIHRFNVFQEIVLAALYRALEPLYFTITALTSEALRRWHIIIPGFPAPIFFYVYSCFCFAAIGVYAIFWLTLALNGEKEETNWSAGLLAISWLFSNLEDATRVNFTLNLRENFALPIFWLQNYYIVKAISTLWNDDNFKSSSNKCNYFCIALTTLLFSAFWQFNQFILTLQSASLFSLLIFINLNRCSQKNAEKVICDILLLQMVGFFILIAFQGFQPMLLTAISMQLNVAIIISTRLMHFIPGSHKNSTTISAIHILIVLCILIIFTVARQCVFQIHSDDSHIWEFAKAKFGRLIQALRNHGITFIYELETPFPISELADLPFESTIYLCHGAFVFLDIGFFERTLKSGLVPLYAISIVGILFASMYQIYAKYRSKNEDIGFFGHNSAHPLMLYFLIQSILSGIMACLMLRLKFFWLPQMSSISACYFAKLLDRFIGRQTRNIVLVAIAAILLSKRYDAFRAEMANEQEFYDPDTVQLMNWISKETPPNAIFAGSMQLMAGVKCCSNRPIANHPHFEDKALRQRTQQLYQIYAKKTPVEIHKILRDERVNYIIVEESICFVPPNGCTTGELMDLVNRHIPAVPKSSASSKTISMTNEIFTKKGFKSETKIERFCSKVREFTSKSSSLFQLVLQNRTFRVYQVL